MLLNFFIEVYYIRSDSLVKIILPFTEGQNITNNGAGENVSINVTCDNGANDEINILFTPLIEDIIESRTYSQIIHKQE